MQAFSSHKTTTGLNAFGMVMDGRSWTAGSGGAYRFGMNTQEKDNEIFEGAYSAEYWEYDSRLGRRWNVDPLGFDYPHQSPYTVFDNSPILIIDYLGLSGGPYDAKYNQSKVETVFVASDKKTDKNLNKSLKKAIKAAKNSGGTMKVIQVDHTLKGKDLAEDIQYKLFLECSFGTGTYGTIGLKTVIFDSHGNYADDQFKIGDVTISKRGDGEVVESFIPFLGPDPIVVLLACHAGGNGMNEIPIPLIQGLSKTLNATVYGCRSWTGVVGLFDGKTSISQPNPEHLYDETEGPEAKKDQPLAWENLGSWNKCTSGGPIITLQNGINLSNTGSVIERNHASIMNRPSQKLRNRAATKLRPLQRKRRNELGKKIGRNF